MRTGRGWHRAQLIVTRGSFERGAWGSAHPEGGLTQMGPGSDTPEHAGSRRPPTRPNIPGHDDPVRHARTFRIPTTPDTPEHPGSRRPGPTRPNIPDPDDPATLRRRILARDSRGAALGVPEDEIEIARLHEEPGRRADDEQRGLPLDGIGEQRTAA